jgi:hypothetical protein
MAPALPLLTARSPSIVLRGALRLGSRRAQYRAGIYLLSYNSERLAALGGQSGKSWFEVIANGIGIYFIGKGIYMFRTARLASNQLEIDRERH